MAANGFLSCINSFTRVTSHSKTDIDHFFIKNVDKDIINSYILRCDVTNHYAKILILSNLQNNVNQSSNCKILNKINLNNLDYMVEVFFSKISDFINYSHIAIINYK